MERKDIIILIVSLLLFIAVLSAVGLFLRNKKSDEHLKAEQRITVVEGTLPGKSTSGAGDEERDDSAVAIGSSAYFLTPSADEILSALRESETSRLDPVDEDAPPMKVMWPGYFFSLKSDKLGDTTMQLDVDENGFGVVLLCRVDLSAYPEVKDLAKGEKIWVAGEVTSIDLTGTGTVAIEVEYIRFDEGPPAAQSARTK